jgi:hypothetical protein
MTVSEFQYAEKRGKHTSYNTKISGIRRLVLMVALSIIFDIRFVLPGLAVGPGTGWLYYRPINLNIPTPDANFQIKVTLSKEQNANIKPDGSDLRFYDKAGNNCDYWIETWNTQGTSTIWVNVKTPGTDILVMYYGNRVANAVSNGNTTFDFFDDFTTTLSDKWTISGSVTQSGSMVTLANTNGITAATLSNTNAFTPSSSSFYLETKHYEVGYNRNRFYATTSTGGGSPLEGVDYGYFADANLDQPIGKVFWNKFPSSTSMSNDIVYLTQWSITDGSTYNWVTCTYSTGVPVLYGSKTTTCSSIIRYISISVTDVAKTSSIIDWIRLRKGSVREPIGTVGAQFVNTVPTTPALFSNSGVFIVPDGVTSITVECWGGGGAGGQASKLTNGNGGGGGGAYAQSTVAVIPGRMYSVNVGAGGIAGIELESTSGGQSSFETSVIALGGSCGNNTSGSILAGAGGQASGSTGAIKYSGGNGGDGYYGYSAGGGGGGSSATSSGDGVNGNAASGSTGGNGGIGANGDGGNGGGCYSSGTFGTAPGGGGGGKGSKGGISGNGANGQVILSWCVLPAAPTVSSPVTLCQNSSAGPLTAMGADLLWYATSTGGTGSSTAPTPSTSTIGTTAYYVSQITGCESPRVQIEVIVNPPPSASVSAQTNISCFGGEDGTITISACGGIPPYFYSVDNGSPSGWVFSNDNPYTFTGLKANIPYKIRVKDSNGCESPEIP